jgi:hypothetical protein
MKVKVYFKNKNSDVQKLVESLPAGAKSVKVKAAEYDATVTYDLDFEDRIICGADTILSDTQKLLGIIDMELFMMPHHYIELKSGEIVEFDSHRFIKTPHEYLPVEIEAE